MKSFLVVFFGIACVDILWAIYFLSVTKKKVEIASLMSGVIILLGSTVTVEYVHNPTLRYAAAAGAMVGTWIALKVHAKLEKKIAGE